MQAVITRLNKAPGKNLLAFLDTMGISLIAPEPARAPVAFQPVPRAANGQVPAGAQLGAKVAGQAAPLSFETENAIAMAAAKLVQVAVVWPSQDRYADYSSSAAGGRSFGLYTGLQPIPHAIYLANNTLFAFNGQTRIQLSFELAVVASSPLSVAWEFWDGQVWRPFAPFDPALDANPSVDATDGFTRSGVITLHAECGKSAQTTVQGIQGYWLRGRLTQPLPPDPTQVLPQVQRIRAALVLDHSLPPGVSCAALPKGAGLPFDSAFSGTQKVDLSKTFFPFDKQPQTGNVFYFTNQEAFSKPFATVTVSLATAKISQQPDPGNWASALVPTVNWEYWNGSQWATLTLDSGTPATQEFLQTGTITFRVPPDLASVTVNKQAGLWMRARLAGLAPQQIPDANNPPLNYGGIRIITYLGPTPGGKKGDTTTFNFNVIEIVPPALDAPCLGYVYSSPWSILDQCFTFNDFQWQNHTHDVRWPGTSFFVFSPTTDTTPSLYLGFDQPLPNDYVSLYLDIDETTPPTTPLLWEGWDGTQWQPLQPADGTHGLSLPGMVAFVAPAVAPRPQISFTQASASQVVTASAQDAARFQANDLIVVAQGTKSELASVQDVQGPVILLQASLAGSYIGGTATLAALPRFRTSLDWVRARLKEDGAPSSSQINGIYLNAVWAVQKRSNSNEAVGAGSGQPSQTLRLNQIPVLPGERIEVRELSGASAPVELPILTAELLARGFTNDDIRTVQDARSGAVTEVWVRWQEQPNLYFSSPDDRHYMIERATGRLIFGDGINHGMLVPVSALVTATQYQSGGGSIGNVPPGAITQLLTGVLAQSVNNPRAGEGGADGETIEEVAVRGPNTFRHLGRALAAVDYESLSFEASPAVASVRVLPTTAANGLPEPGFVKIVIVPHSQDSLPQPSFDLRQTVHDYLEQRAPATVPSDRISVVGPTYLQVGVYAAIVPRESDQAGSVESAAVAALQAFLNPVNGGPEGRGWPFGRGVFLSDIAAILDALNGVDYVRQLELIVDNAPVGDQVTVPPDKILGAGTIQIVMLPAAG
jgi:Baseplate J-like protein